MSMFINVLKMKKLGGVFFVGMLSYDEYDYNGDLSNIEKLNKNLLISPFEGIIGSFHWFNVTFDCFEYEADSDFIRPVLDNQSRVKIREILKFFNREDEDIENFEQEHGLNGFRYKITLQEGAWLMFYGPKTSNDRFSTALWLSGTACEWLIARNKFIDVIRYTLQYSYRYTRFDSCLDNFTDLMSMDSIYYNVSNLYYVTCFKKLNVIGTPNPNSSYKYDGLSIYGGKGSSLELCIYAKNWEQGKADEIKNWVRWEIRLSDHERIKQLLILIVLGYGKGVYNNYFSIVAGMLKELVMFKVPCNDTNISRWEDDPEYLSFLNGVESIKLLRAPKTKGQFEISLNWFQRSCSLFLTQLSIIYGEDKLIRYLKYLIINRFSSFKANDWNLIINEYERQNKLVDKRDVAKMMDKFTNEVNILEFNESLKFTDEALDYVKKIKEEESQNNE